MKKLMLTLVAVFTLFSATETFAVYPLDGCTREYDPVPYITKDGKIITAPNECVAALWTVQGK